MLAMQAEESIRAAIPADLTALVELMRGYYRDDGLEFDETTSPATLARLLSESQWGRVWVLESAGRAVGYIAICFGFSLELGGNDAIVDEVFVLPEHRGRGHGRRLLKFAGAETGKLGVKALHLEVDRGNAEARRLYDALGYRSRDRYLVMTKMLTEPDS